MSLLEVSGLTTEFRVDGRWAAAVDGVDFELRRGETLGLVGESGCGKSTVAYSLLRLLPPNARIAAGKICYGGQDLAQLPDARLRRMRGKNLAMIFQNPMTSLDPAVRIGPQIIEALLAHEYIGRNVAQERAVSLLRDVGIPAAEERMRAYPHELSGGMRQRVALAIAMSCNPDVLIADEPTTALDVTIQAQILKLVRELLVEEHGTGVLLITHDLGVVAQVCDRVAVMYAGRIIETGDVSDIFSDPRHPYTRALLAAVPRPETSRGKLAAIEGRVPALGARPPGCSFRSRCTYARAECAAPNAPPRIRLGPNRTVDCVLEHDR